MKSRFVHARTTAVKAHERHSALDMWHIRYVNDLDFSHLAALEALVRLQSVTGAATELGLSQPSMSRKLKVLRARLDDPVLVRSGNEMSPTPRAARVARAAKDALAQLERALDPAPFDARSSTRCIKIAAWDYTQMVFLGSLLEALTAHAPKMSIAVVPVTARSPVAALESGEVDLSVGLHRDLRADYMRRRVFKDRFVVCARRDHVLFAQRMTLRRYAAARHLLVAPFGPTRPGVVDEALKSRGLTRTISAFVPSFLSAPAVLMESDLIATLPERLARRSPGLATKRAPIALPEFSVEVVWHARGDKDPALKLVRGLISAR